MAENISSNTDSLLKRTLVTVAAMVGACVVVVGTLSLIAVLVVGKAVGDTSGAASEGPTLVPADKVHGSSPKPPGKADGTPGGPGAPAPQMIPKRVGM